MDYTLVRTQETYKVRRKNAYYMVVKTKIEPKELIYEVFYENGKRVDEELEKSVIQEFLSD